MLNQLINSNVGFVWGVRAAAFITLGCFILGNALIFIPRKTTVPALRSGQSTPQSLSPVKSSMWDTPYVITLFSAFLLSLGSNTPTFYVQLFAETQGVDKTFAFNSLAILNAGSIVGRVLPSFFADRFGALNVYIPLLAATGMYSPFPKFPLLI
jgi:fucose permease